MREFITEFGGQESTSFIFFIPSFRYFLIFLIVCSGNAMLTTQISFFSPHFPHSGVQSLNEIRNNISNTNSVSAL